MYVGPGGPSTGFCIPGEDLTRIYLVAANTAQKPPPGLQKPVPGPPGPPLYSLLAPPCTIIRGLRVLTIYYIVYKTSKTLLHVLCNII